MITYIILSLIKILDNVILTFKSIATYKEEKILSSVLVVVSQLTFYLVIDHVISDNTLMAIIIVSVSSGIGNLLAFNINDKFKRDDKWWIYVTTSDITVMKELCEHLRTNKIKYGALNGLNRREEDSIHVIIFSKTKEESKIVQKFLDSSDRRYLLEIIK